MQAGAKIDFVLKNGSFVEVKNYNWASNYYQKEANLRRVIRDFVDEAKEYYKYTDQVKFVFNGSVPDAVCKALEDIGVVVEVVP